MLCLLVGWAAGGAVHLLLVLALVLFPWMPTPEEMSGEMGTTGEETKAVGTRATSGDEDQSSSAGSSSPTPSSSSS